MIERRLRYEEKGVANRVRNLGGGTIALVQRMGNMGVFAGAVGRAAVVPPVRFGALVREMHKSGVLSLVIVCLSGMAVGMVMGLQGYHMLVRFGAQQSLGAVVGLSLIRELGPVITGLLVTGRAGSATTAEIGAMVATEQLDGLRMLSIDPVHMIIKPRAIALALAMPMLTAMFILCGIVGGYIAGVVLMGVDPGIYMTSVRESVDFHNDVLGCMIKSVVFGIILSIIATYRGYTSAPTSEGVSSATTTTVVTGSVAILMFDYVITAIWGV